MKKIFSVLAVFVLLGVQGFAQKTFTVNVPAGTKACYLVGAPDWNAFNPMEKVNDTQYTLTTSAVNGTAYKYCSGPGWNYVEKKADGGDINNRSYAASDQVANWASVYDPSVVEEVKCFIKNNWNGGDWDWKEMTPNTDSTEWSYNGVFGGTGVDIKTSENGSSSWFAVASISGNPQSGTEYTFVYDVDAKTVTANPVGPGPKYTYDTTMCVAGNFTNWAAGMQELPYTINLPKDSTIAFKQVRVVTTWDGEIEMNKDTAWFGQATENYYMTRKNVGEGWLLDGEYDVLLTTDTIGDYTFYLKGDNFMVDFPEMAEPEVNYYIAGDGKAETGWCCGKNWDAKGCPMTDDQYSATVPAGTYQFKVTNGSWDTSWGYDAVDAEKSTEGYENGDGNVKFTVASEANITVTFDGTSIVLLSDVSFGKVTINSWTVAGDSALLGVKWDPTATANDMSFVGGAYTLTKSNVELAAGDYNYKFTANHAWNVQELPASGNQILNIAEEGTYDITFTLNATGTEGGAEAVLLASKYTYDSTMFVAGNFTKWENEMQELPYTINLPADSTIEFKQVCRVIKKLESEPVDTALVWYGAKGENPTMTRVNSTWLLDGDKNVKLTTDAAGEYKFALNENGEFVVTWPGSVPSALEALLMNDQNDGKFIWNGQMIIRRNGMLYDARGQRLR